MSITFDPAKRSWTLQHRGLDFAIDAAIVFAGKVATTRDDRFDYGEERFITAGYIGTRMVVIAWTPRGENRHVVSMRYCHDKEKARWTARIRRPPD